MDLKITTLDNGLTVVTDTMPHLRSAALGVWVNAGSRSERENEHGLSHLLEHMAFKGTTTRSAIEIAEEIEAVGGELNAATSIENTAFYARVLSDQVPLALNILSDILQNATLDEDELIKEKHVILQEIGASLDMPEDVVFDKFQEVAYRGQVIGRPILGTPESVQSFNATSISDYLARHYQSEKMVICAAGDVSHDDIVRLVKEKFSSIPKGKGETPSQARYMGGEFIEHRSLQEAQILIGFEGCSYHHDDFYAVQCLAAILGGGMSSRLFQQVREKRGLCYSIYAFHWAYSDTGLFGIHAATGEEDINALMPVMLDELDGVRLHVAEAELNRVKAQMGANILMGLESPAGRATQLARQMMVFGRCMTPDEQIAAIEAVTSDDIKRVARTIFTTDNPTLAAIGPVKGMMTTKEIVARLKMAQAAE